MRNALLAIAFAFCLQDKCKSDSSPEWEPFIIRVSDNSPLISLESQSSSEKCLESASNIDDDFDDVTFLDTLDWRNAGWCSDDNAEACPDKLLSSYIKSHENHRAIIKRDGGLSSNSLEMRRFLACKPLGGIGNVIAGLLSCLAMALVTNRSLLLARPAPSPRDSVSSYEQPVPALFDFPFNVSLDVLGSGVEDIPFLFDAKSGTAIDTETLQMIDVRTHDFLCQNLSQAYHRPIAVMPSHLWLGAIAHNPHHSSFFDQHFGRDEYGTVPFVAMLGAWFFRPKPHILAVTRALAAAVTHNSDGLFYGLQLRTGLPGDTYTDRPPLSAAPEYVRCAYAHTPLAQRGRRAAWVVAADGADARRAALAHIAAAEGPITAAAGEAALRDGLGLPSEYFAAGGRVGARRGAVAGLEGGLAAAAAELGFAVVQFASGSRAVVLARPPRATSAEGMAAAAAEMWLLGRAAVLVVTENSTFWLPAVSFARRRRRDTARRRAVYVMTRGRRCYPLPATEPVSDAGYRARQQSRSPCYDDSLHLDPSTLWLPP